MKKLHMPKIQITHNAVMLYASEGPKGLTMRALAKTLGICASALYRHFRNKDAIIDAVVEAAEERLAVRMKPNPRIKPPRDRARALAEKALQFSLDQPHLFHLVTRRKPHWHDANGSRRAKLMREELEQSMREGRLKRDRPEAAMQSLWAQICGLGALKERGELPASPDELREAWLSSAKRLLSGMAA